MFRLSLNFLEHLIIWNIDIYHVYLLIIFIITNSANTFFLNLKIFFKSKKIKIKYVSKHEWKVYAHNSAEVFGIYV